VSKEGGEEGIRERERERERERAGGRERERERERMTHLIITSLPNI
jgi:hypothetical protein